MLRVPPTPAVKSVDDFHERIVARLAPIKIITEKTAKYIVLIEDLVLGYNPSQYTDVIEAVARLRILHAEISAIRLDISASCNVMTIMTGLYTRFAEIDRLLEISYQLFANKMYARAATYNRSATYSNEVHRESGLVYDAKDKLALISARDDDNIFEFVLPYCGNIETDIFNYIMTVMDIVNKFTTKLIAYALRNQLSDGKRNSLREIIEQQKDTILSSGYTPIVAPGIVGLCERYNLLPGPAQTKEEIIAQINGSETDFAAIAKLGHGIIIVDISTSSPITFDISGLVDSEYILSNKLDMKPLSGLTKKVLTRYATAKMLSVGTSPPAPMKIYSGKLPTWYIISMIGDNTYRLMKGVENTGHTIDKYIHINPRILRGLSSRPIKYNDICAVDILQNTVATQIIQQVADYVQIIPASTEPDRAKIIDKLMKLFDLAEFKTPADFKGFLTSEMISSTVMTTLHPRLTERNITEHMTTYVLHMETLTTQLCRELWKRMYAESLNRLFSEHGSSEIKELLSVRFRLICTKSLDEIDKLGLFINYNYGLKGYVLAKSNVII